MNGFTIYIVEDEKAILDTLKLNLELENYAVITANSGNNALDTFRSNHKNIHLILLDVMLPEINGFELFNEFKAINPQVPIIFLTAKNQNIDKIAGLKLGADDYLTKPFDLEELLLRIQNVLKRYPEIKSNTVFTFKNGSINFETFEISDINQQMHGLSKREIGLLQLLTSNENKVISRDEIIEKLWTIEENPSSRTIDNYILNFRKYFESNPKEPQHFHSIRGVGYKFTT
jgi:two-component system alkaline phosphatase synthesis response regulator PhoP